MGNSASAGGGGAFFGGDWDEANTCYPQIINSTISDNWAGGRGGGICGVGFCDITISNSILWQNSANVDNEIGIYIIIAERGPSPNPDILVSYSDVEGGLGGIQHFYFVTWDTGSIDADPFFAGPDDYRLPFGSPCIDTGTNSPAGGLAATDINGNSRLVDGNNDGTDTVDMGPYEYPSIFEPYITFLPADFSFSGFEAGANPNPQSLFIRNSGTTLLNWTISENCPWLSVSPSSGSSTGEPNEVTLSVDTSGLVGGDYNCQLVISDPNAYNDPRTVDVDLHVTGPIIDLSASQFDFFAEVDEANPADQILAISNIGGGTLNWAITETCDWLVASPMTGSSTGGLDDVTFSVDMSGLDPGDHFCQLTVVDSNAQNSPQTIDVTLHLAGPIIGVSTSSLAYSADFEGANPADQTFGISNNGVGTLNWAITETCDWLVVSPTSGSTMGSPNNVTISVDISGLDPGDYLCQLTVLDSTYPNNSQTINVTLHVTGATIGLSTSSLTFSAIEGGPNPNDQIFAINNNSGGTLRWEIIETCDWLVASPASGTSTGELDNVTVSINISGLDPGNNNCELTIWDPNAENNPRTVNVDVNVDCAYGGPDYDEWTSKGSPGSWCWDYQCHGDADNAEQSFGSGRGSGITRVGTNDLAILAATYNVYMGDLRADFDHASQQFGSGRGGGLTRTGTLDLAVLAFWWNNTDVPGDCQTASPAPN